jgi:hypothetical protein
MNLICKKLPRRRTGYALILVMCFLAVSLILFGSMMYWVSSNAKITVRNNYYNTAEAAAESATETVLGNMLRDFNYGALNAASSYTGLRPDQSGWPLQYQFSNVGVTIGAANWQVLSSQFSGLFGLVQNCSIGATATAANGPAAVPATVQQTVQFAAIPLFQYAIFYNMDLEINPGAGMKISGHVHSNNNIWTTGASSSQLLTYSSLVDASGTVFLRRSTNDPQSSTIGNVVFTLTHNNPLNNVDSLSMPIGTNNDPASIAAILGLPPGNMAAPNAEAYSPNGSAYLYNGSDLIVSNYSGGTRFSVLYDNQYNVNQLTLVPPDVVVITTNFATGTYTTNSYYSFVTNATFYDYRESDTVQAIQVDISKLRTWLTNTSVRGGYQYNILNNSGSTSKGHGINSVYVYNTLPVTSSQLPAVRLVNGQQLPSDGLTIATPQPLYVMGDYNTTTNGINFDKTLGSTVDGNNVPAALMGDAVTILSGNWKDSNTSGTALSSRNASVTTINAACLEGIVESYTDSSGNKHYSGGVENFLRMLENWSGVDLNYNGSIVVMFPSQYATHVWPGTGNGPNVYNPPNRNWGFDVNFSKGPKYLPPLTPMARYIVRSSWASQ